MTNAIKTLFASRKFLLLLVGVMTSVSTPSGSTVATTLPVSDPPKS